MSISGRGFQNFVHRLRMLHGKLEALELAAFSRAAAHLLIHRATVLMQVLKARQMPFMCCNCTCATYPFFRSANTLYNKFETAFLSLHSCVQAQRGAVFAENVANVFKRVFQTIQTTVPHHFYDF